jgi:hypothetical protein
VTPLLLARRAFLFAPLSLAGCMTPTSRTQVVDPSYTTKITNLNLVLVPGRFPAQEALLKAQGMAGREWYEKLAVRMQANFAHNGVQLAGHVLEPGSRSMLDGRSPTLVVKFDRIFVQDSRIISSLNMTMTLHAPGRDRPVWEALTGAAPYRAADELSLRILNDLRGLQLVDTKFAEAQTTEGHRSISLVGGVMTK